MNKQINPFRRRPSDDARAVRRYCEECGGVSPQPDRDAILDKHFRRLNDAGVFRPF